MMETILHVYLPSVKYCLALVRTKLRRKLLPKLIPSW